MKKTEPTLLSELEAERARLVPIAEQASRLPAAEAALAAAFAQEQEWLRDPQRPRNSSVPDTTAIENSRLVSVARDERNRLQREPDEARRRIAQIDALLGAKDNAKRAADDLANIASEGAALDRKVAGVAELVAGLRQEIAATEHQRDGELERAAEAAVAAKLDGKAAPAPARGDGEGAARKVERLTAELGAASRVEAAMQAQRNELAERAEEARRLLIHAKANAAHLALMLAARDVASIVLEAEATRRASRIYLPAIAFEPDELALARRVAEIERECTAWRPAGSVDADSTDEAPTEERAEAAA